MTQLEVEAVLSALKRKDAETATIIHEKYERNREAIIHNRKVALDDIQNYIDEAHRKLIDAKAALYKCERSSDEWKEKAMQAKTASDRLIAYQKQIQEANQYCKEELRKNLERRDSELRSMHTQYRQEKDRLLAMVQRHSHEDQLSYWRDKYHRAIAELSKPKAAVHD